MGQWPSSTPPPSPPVAAVDTSKQPEQDPQPEPQPVTPPPTRMRSRSPKKPKPFPGTRHVAQTVHKDRTVVFLLGASKSGKSAFVNHLNNVLDYEKLEDAISKPKCPIRTRFLFNNRVVQFGVIGNEDPDSVPSTRQPRVYDFNPWGTDRLLTVVDIPGCDVDPGRMTSFNHFISILTTNYNTVNAICLFVPANIVEDPDKGRYMLSRYLSIIPEVALKNVFFIISHETEERPAVDAKFFIHDFTSDLQFPKDRMNRVFAISNEIFQYIVVCNVNPKIKHNPSYGKRWIKNKREIFKLLIGIGNVHPVSTNLFCNLYRAQSLLKNFIWPHTGEDVSLTADELAQSFLTGMNVQPTPSKVQACSKFLLQLVTFVNTQAHISWYELYSRDLSDFRGGLRANRQKWMDAKEMFDDLVDEAEHWNGELLDNEGVMVNNFIERYGNEQMQMRLRFEYKISRTTVIKTAF